MRGSFALTVASAVGLLLAGCVDSGTSAATGLGSTTAPPAEVSSDTGSITGLILDDENKPIVGADVAATGPSQVASQSDGEGRFTLNGLAPGSYVVSALRLGYEAIAKRVDVAAGEASNVTLVLQTLAISSDPYIDYKITDGFLAGPNFYSAGLIVYNTYSFGLNLTKGAQDIYASMQWDANAPTTARYLRVGITYPTTGGTSSSAAGKSPVTANHTEIEMKKDEAKATIFYSIAFLCSGATLTPQCFLDNPDALLPVIVYQQRVKIYSSVFYHQNAPEGYTGLPE